jgi:hypothetical protein
LVQREQQASYESCTVSLKSIVLVGWMDGCKSGIKDWVPALNKMHLA